MEVEQHVPRVKRERKPSAKAAEPREAKQARSGSRQLFAPFCDPLQIGSRLIPSVTAFAMEHRDKLELAHASTALLDREARLREEDAQVMAWEARRQITVGDMRYSKLPSAFCKGAKFTDGKSNTIFWRVKQVGRRLADGPAGGHTRTLLSMSMDHPSSLRNAH